MADITATIGGTNSSGPSKVSVTTPSASVSNTFSSLNDVSATSPANNDIIQFNSSTNLFTTTSSPSLSTLTVTTLTAGIGVVPTLKSTSSSQAFAIPTTDGSSGQVIVTDGSGNLSFATVNNSALSNSTLTVTDGSNSTATALGGTITFSAGEGLDVVESSGTITFSGEDATTSNKGIASFSSDNFSVSSGAVSIKDGGIVNAELANSSINFGGVSLALGGSDTTPAFDLSDATNYPTSSLTGTITNAQLAGSIANAKLSNSTITVSDGSSSTATALGGTITFSGTNNEITVGESSGTITFSLPDNVTIGNDLVVTGDLTVSGDTTTVSTTNTVVKDQLFELGNGRSGSASGDAGLIIERGSDSNAFIGFDESADKFIVGTGSFTGASTGNLTITTGELVANIDGSNSTLTNIPNSALTNSSITINGSAVSLGGSTSINTSLTLAADSGSNDTFTTGGTLTFTGGEGIDTTVSDDTITIAGEEASTSNKGVASFSSDNFAVSSGVVTIKDSGIANAELAGSIANSKLANSSITVTDGSSSTATALGGTITFSAGEGLDVAESSGTITFSGEDATTSNKGVASFSSDDFSVSSGAVTVKSGGITNAQLAGSIANDKLAGSIANSKLANSSVNFGGVSLALGGSDTTPAFDLSDATNYPTSSLSGTITNAQLAGSIANSKLANSSITINGSSVSLGGSTSINTSLTLAADSGSNDSFSTGSTLTFSGGEGIDTTVGDDEITIAGEDATASNKGIASFSSDDFSVSSGAVTVKAGGITNTQLAGSIANSKLANSSITINGVAIALGGTVTTPGSDNPITIGDDSSNQYDVNLGTSLSFLGGEGINTQVAGGTVTVSAEDATASNKGVASFSSDDFSVSSGAVTVKAGGITNAQLAGSIANAKLANSSITINGSGVSLGGSVSIDTSFTLAADSGSNDSFSTGNTLTFSGGEGIDTTVSDDEITIAGEDASTSNKGVASFASADFDVSSGAVSIKAGGVSTTQLTIDGHLIPDTDDVYDLGSASRRWRNLFVGADTINIGGATISSDGSGELSLSASGVTLPQGSKVKDAKGQAKRVSFADDNDQPVLPVSFFSNAEGTGTPNAILEMRKRDAPTLTFIKNDGTTQGAVTMFSFN